MLNFSSILLSMLWSDVHPDEIFTVADSFGGLIFTITLISSPTIIVKYLWRCCNSKSFSDKN